MRPFVPPFVLAVFLGAVMAGPSAHAQAVYPGHAVTLVAPSAAGGPVDTMARIVADGLSRHWKQPVIVENKVGASGTIGSTAVAKSKPDGHTLLLAFSGPIGQMEVVRPTATPYRALADFRPVGVIALAPVMIWIRRDLGITTVAQLVARAKATPGKLSFATGGTGTTSHLAMELFKDAAGIDLLHVPFSTSSQAPQAFLGGHVDILTIGAVGIFDAVEASGKAVKIATVASQRYSKAPDVPTLLEAGYKGANLDGWFGVMVPAATPNEIVDTLERDFLAAMNSSSSRAQIAGTGADPSPGNREALQKLIRGDIENIGGLVRRGRLALQ